jgi:hypothetical protein
MLVAEHSWRQRISWHTVVNVALAMTHAPSPFEVSDFSDIDGTSVPPDGLCME